MNTRAKVTPETHSIGFIGIGVMGKSMAGHLLRAGYKVWVYNRTKAKAEALLEAGAQWAENPKAVAGKADVILTMVGYPSDVEETYFGANGLLANAKAGAVFVDFTTSSPLLAARIAAAANEKGMSALDAPVTGGDKGAREAALAIMVGGEAEAYSAVLPLLEKLGKSIRLLGPAGSGQHAKMVNQLLIAGTMMGMAEALAYAEKSGLNAEQVLATIGSGAAGSWSLANLAPRILKGDFQPGFYVKHFIKDLQIALDCAEQMKLELPALRLAKALYEKLAAAGGGDYGTQALIKLYLEGKQA